MKKYYLIIISMIFIGCSGAVYKNYTTYTPPLTPVGKSCISQCSKSRSSCEQLEYKSCHQRESDKVKQFDACVKQAELDSKRKDKNKIGYHNCSISFSFSSCSLNNEICKASYDSCYGQCGGKVDSKKICVENCKN